MSDFKPSQWATASVSKQGRAPVCCTPHRTPNQQAAGPGGSILEFRYFGQQTPCMTAKICANIHNPRVQTQRRKSRYKTWAPTLAGFRLRAVFGWWGPGTSQFGCVGEVRMDKSSHSGTVRAGFYHSDVLSSTWAFCHIMFAPKVTFQTDLYCHVLYTLRT